MQTSELNDLVPGPFLTLSEPVCLEVIFPTNICWHAGIANALKTKRGLVLLCRCCLEISTFMRKTLHKSF